MARKKAKATPPKMITVYAEILQETEDAILVRCDDDADGVWLPKSQIGYDGERGDTGVEIEIPEWLANEKGFFDGMGYAPAQVTVAPAEPIVPDAEPLPEPEHDCRTCINFSIGDGTCDNCSADNDDAADDLWSPANDEPRCETCARHGADYPDDCDTCQDDHDSLVNWKPSHPCFDPDFREVESPAPADTPAAKRVFGDNVKWIAEESITVSFPLSDAEKARYAEESAALDKEIEELEAERSDVSSRLKKQIDAKEQERREMSAHVRNGESRTISCDCLKDYNTGEMVWTSAHPPYEEVQRRKMTKEEMQPTLLEFEEKAASGAPAVETSGPFAEGMDGLDVDTLSSPSPLDESPEEEASVGDAMPYYPSCETCAHNETNSPDACDQCAYQPGADATDDSLVNNWEPLPQPEQSRDCAEVRARATEPATQTAEVA